MRSLFSGSYEQVKNKVNRSSAQYGIHFIQDFGTLHLLVFLIFFIGGIYGLYGFYWYTSHHMDEAVVSLDLNNEYISLPPVMWITHLTALLFGISGVVARCYSKRNNAKGYFMYNLLASIALFPFLILFFILGQLFVTSFAVRVFYALFFIVMCIYVPFKGYRNAVNFVFDVNEKHTFEQWLTHKAGWLMAILTVIAGPYYFIKTLFGSAGDFEKNLVGALTGYFPLIAGLALLMYLYMFNLILRSYYLYKYADTFQQQFGVSKETWYGDVKFEDEEEETEAAEERGNAGNE